MIKPFSNKTFLLFLGIVVCGYLFSPQTVHAAAAWDWIVGAITFLPSAALNIVLQLLVLIWSVIAGVAGLLLNAVTSSGFISWSYTNPATNPVIAAGYSITRSFVNMGLVLALIYISFATILRLGNFQTQKMLVNLVVVALLVNFAPVICGFFVDASNIATFYFTDHLTGFSKFLNSLKGIGDSLAASFTTIEVTKQLGIVFQSLVLIAFNMALSLILFAFAVLFLFRYVAIWVAVILAPLAFVAYILPATKKYFDMWFKNFTQWCIIGVVGGFFLFLGENVANIMPSAPIKSASSGYGVFDAVLPHFVTLAFLLIGLIMALTTSAFGAKEIAGGLKKGGKAARSVATNAQWKGIREAVKAPSRIFGINKGVESYGIMRRLGLGRKEALRAGILRTKSELGTRGVGGIIRATGQEINAAKSGTIKAIRDSAKAGWGAALGKKKPKKKFRTADGSVIELDEVEEKKEEEKGGGKGGGKK